MDPIIVDDCMILGQGYRTYEMGYIIVVVFNPDIYYIGILGLMLLKRATRATVNLLNKLLWLLALFIHNS